MENQEKRTLTSEEKQEEKEANQPSQSQFLALILMIAVVLIMSGALGVLTAKYENLKTELKLANTHNEFLEGEIDRLTKETLSSEQDTAPSVKTSETSSAAGPSVPTPEEPNPEITATYRYSSIADIPEVLPGDTLCLQFKVDQPCSRAQAGTVLAVTTRETIGVNTTITVPELGEISDQCAKYGYGLIGVFIESIELGRASFTVFAFNPEETPYIELYTASNGWMYPSMDVQVFDMVFYARNVADEEGMYRSTGVSERNYGYFGGSNSGNDDYAFDAFHVVKLDVDDWCYPLDWALDDIPEYYDYWQENRDLVMTRREYFSGDRNHFYLIDYLDAIKTVKIKNISASSVTLYRSDGSELVIQKHYGDETRGDYATFTKDGEDYRYALAYHPRVNGLPTRIYLENGIPLTSEQVLLLLKFIENPAPLF